MKTIDKLIEEANYCGWDTYDDGEDLELSIFSPAGQDFSFYVTSESAELAISDLHNYIANFDPIERASIWVGKDGHGKNGAPDDPRDIIKDMEDCKEMMQELLNVWRA